jgi:hypothetical protein
MARGVFIKWLWRIGLRKQRGPAWSDFWVFERAKARDKVEFPAREGRIKS